MRLGLNLLFLHERLAGVRVYGTELAKELAAAALRNGDAVTFFVPRAQEQAFAGFLSDFPAAERLRADVQSFDLDPARKLALLWHEQALLPLRAWRAGVTDLYSFDYRAPYLFPRRKYGTILDVNFRDRPDNFTRAQRAIRAVSVVLTLKLCRRVCTMSEFSAGRIRERYPWYRKPLAVVPAGVAWRSPSDTPKTVGASFILSVGTLAKHKNYVRLVEAFAGLSDPRLELVIAGKAGNAADDVRAAIARCGVKDRVTITGYVDAATLEGLYRDAVLFVTASEYEGFGIPVLEAMQRGLPVACSASAALPEVVGDAAVLFDATSVESIRDALARATHSEQLRARLKERGSVRVQQFTWDAAARSALRTMAAA